MSTPAVLIVDDEKNILLTLGMALESLSISVDTADTGAAAWISWPAGPMISCSWTCGSPIWTAWKSCAGFLRLGPRSR
jgi:hypothetical protein